jgi:hypothetical protein
MSSSAETTWLPNVGWPLGATICAIVLIVLLLVALIRVVRQRDTERDGRIAERDGRIAEFSRAERIARDAFMAKLAAISASACEVSGSSDVARRGCPDPVLAPLDTLLDEVPDVDQRLVSGRWAKFCALYDAWPVPRGSPEREVAQLQPVIGMILRAAAGESPKLKAWHGVIASDEINLKEIAPDFSFTRLREAMLCVIAVIFAVEVKLRGKLVDAWQQALCYGRRRVNLLVKEALERGDAADGVEALVAGTDGRELVVCKIGSGAPAPGESFEGCVPCPSQYSLPVELLPRSWTYTARARPPARPTLGFAVLVRILSADAASLPGGAAGAPLQELRTTRGPLALQERLGAGGMSDVYAVDADTVAKVARAGTAGAATAFEAEMQALTALAAVPVAGVPRIVECRVLQQYRGISYSVANPAAQRYALILSPRGIPLATHMQSKKFSSRDVLLFANFVVARLLQTCAAVFDAGIVHCDIRPDNVVIDGSGDPVLVDFSCCRKPGTRYLQEHRAFGCRSSTANAATDLVATSLLWVAIAHGGCGAPWTQGAASRELWMANNLSLAGVAAVAAYVAQATSGGRRRVAWTNPVV